MLTAETAINPVINPSDTAPRRSVLSLKPGDYGVIAVAAVLIMVSACIVYGGRQDALIFTIKGRDGTWTFPVDAREIVRIPGPLGDTLVELRRGEARILSSPCANRSCIAAGSIHAGGQWIACLPNNVMVSVEGRAQGLDGAAW
ncbi:MAG: NusG domain II-containing protein [Treponema sp.]|nr:NusG domain II-containing protein [Treponema sp.]